MTTDDPSARELLLLAAANRLMFATPSSIASFVRTEVNEIETGLAALAARKLVTRDGERVLLTAEGKTVASATGVLEGFPPESGAVRSWRDKRMNPQAVHIPKNFDTKLREGEDQA